MTTTPTDAPPLGFWKIAQAYPDHLALVDPDEQAGARGRRCWRRATRSCTGSARWASSPVTPSRCCCRTASRCSSCTSRSSRPASTSSRSTGTSSAPRSRTSCRTARRRRSSRTPGSPSTRRRRPTRSTSPPTGRFAVGGDDRRASAPTTSSRPASPTDDARRTVTTGMVMNYTSGTTGRPKGVRRNLPGVDPETGGGGFGGHALHVRAAAVRRQRAHRRLAAVPHRGARVRGRRDPHRAHASW